MYCNSRDFSCKFHKFPVFIILFLSIFDENPACSGSDGPSRFIINLTPRPCNSERFLPRNRGETLCFWFFFATRVPIILNSIQKIESKKSKPNRVGSDFFSCGWESEY